MFQNIVRGTAWALSALLIAASTYHGGHPLLSAGTFIAGAVGLVAFASFLRAAWLAAELFRELRDLSEETPA